MYIVEDEPTFTHTVKVREPVDGGFKEQSCKATFRVVPTDEAAEFDLSDGKSSAAFLRRAVISLDGLGRSADEPLEYSDALRDKLLNRSYFRAALAQTYFNAVSGAKTGN